MNDNAVLKDIACDNELIYMTENRRSSSRLSASFISMTAIRWFRIGTGYIENTAVNVESRWVDSVILRIRA